MSEAHNVFTEKVNKIVLSEDDDKRIQTHGGIISYPYGTVLELCTKKTWWDT